MYQEQAAVRESNVEDVFKQLSAVNDSLRALVRRSEIVAETLAGPEVDGHGAPADDGLVGVGVIASLLRDLRYTDGLLYALQSAVARTERALACGNQPNANLPTVQVVHAENMRFSSGTYRG